MNEQPLDNDSRRSDRCAAMSDVRPRMQPCSTMSPPATLNSNAGKSDRCGGDRGSVMPMATILVVFLMVGAWALVSAGQQWNARRDAYAAAAAAARAGAQGDPLLLRTGGVLDPDAAVGRAEAILAAYGYEGNVAVDDATVTVTVRVTVDYAFPSPGFLSTVTGEATAVAARGVTGTAGG